MTNPRLKGVEIGREKGVAIGSDLTANSVNSPIISTAVILSASRVTTSWPGQLSAPLSVTLTRPWLLFSTRVSPRRIQPQVGCAS